MTESVRIQTRRRHDAVTVACCIVGGVGIKLAIQDAPLVLRQLDRWPYLRRLPAPLIGQGIWPEPIGSPDIRQASAHQQDKTTP